jgi:hypothetical protein
MDVYARFPFLIRDNNIDSRNERPLFRLCIYIISHKFQALSLKP